MLIVRSSQQWGELKIDEAVSGPLVVNGQHFSHGLGTHAKSRIDIELTKSGRFFTGYCGYPDYASSGRIQCKIMIGDKVVFFSEELNETHRLAKFSVPLGGANSLVLIVEPTVESISWAHAVWVDLAVRESE
jgi:hypothetical protein